MKPGSVKITIDGMKKFKESIEALSKFEVLVGIPQQANTRNELEDENQEMNNATIGYINEHGSDIAGIPARPHLVPGIQNVQKELAKEFKSAGQACFKNPDQVEKYFTRAGIIASNSVKKVITDQEGFEPLAFETIAARKRKGAEGTKALIRTGQYRNAITYVVEKK